MMKKFTSFLAVLLLLVCGATAQTVSVLDTETNLFTSVDQFYSPYTEESEGSVDALIDGNAGTYWHSRWNQGNQPNGTHYMQIEVADLPEEFGFTFTRRPVANDHVTEWSVYGVPSDNANASKEECTLLAEVSTPFISNTETLSSPVIQSKGFTVIRFYAEATTNNRGYWHVSEFAINTVILKNVFEVAIDEALAVYTKYSKYIGTFVTGTVPGNYSSEAVAAFEAALEAAEVLDTPGVNRLTIEDIQQIADNIKTTYAAVDATRVPYAMEVTEGYYFITSSMSFDDNETKAWYTDGNKGKWAGINREDANYLWKVVKAGDRKYHLINCQNENQFTKVATSSAIALSAESDSLVVFDFGGAEGYYNIRLASQAERGYLYLHCGGHGGGAGKQGNLVGWCNTYENDAPHASEWQLEAVDEALALAIIKGCVSAKEIKAMVDAATEIIKTNALSIKSNLAQLKYRVDQNVHLIARATQLYSPQTTNDTQRVDGEYATNEQVMGFLLDGNTSTYWHSRWEDGNRPNGADYIEISDIDAANVAFKMTRRAVANDHITSASVYGYDKTNDLLTKAEGEFLGMVYFPYSNNTETIVSNAVPTKGHKVIRLYEEATNTNRGYWHLAELQMHPAYEKNIDLSVISNLESALDAAIDAWNAIDINVVTLPEEIKDEYDELVSAYGALDQVVKNIGHVNMAIGPAHYATFCAPFNVAYAVDDVQAFTADDVEADGTIVLSELNGTIAPGVPVILYSASEVTETYFGVPLTEDSNCGLLHGVYESTEVPENAYILQNGEDGIGFYKNPSWQSVVLPENRAYLTVGNADVKVLKLDLSQATALKTLNKLSHENATIYDLSGRQLNRLQKGINIVNGVKIRVK